MSAPVTRWTDDPRALALLGSIRRSPPPCANREQRFAVSIDRWQEYAGRRVARLAAIRGEYGARLLAEADASGDYTTLKRDWCEIGDVHDVIDAALGRPVQIRRAA